MGKLNMVPMSQLPKPDYSYFRPWEVWMIYAVEPELKTIADKALKAKRRRFEIQLDAYAEAKNAARKLVGWYARDPRLRSTEAWDCYFDYILDQLNI